MRLLFGALGRHRGQRSAVDRIRIVLMTTVALFVAAASGITLTMLERQETLGKASRYQITWAASQATSEVLRLENRVLGFGIPGSGIGRDEVQLRLDILFNRVSVLGRGDLAGFIAADQEQRDFLDEFGRAVNQLQPLVDRLGEPGVSDDILRRLSALGPKLTRFAVAAAQYSATLIAGDQDHLLRLHWIFTALAAGLLVSGIILAALLFHQYRIVRQAHDRLRQTTDDLLRTKEAAEAASRSKSQFLANMSHELRTPLNAIIGFADVMDRKMFGPLGDARYTEYASDILHSGRHVHELVNDILTMARLEAAHLDLQPEDVETATAVANTVQMFRGTEIARGHRVSVEPGAEWPLLRADERALRQMLLNLLSNAAKFSPEGSEIRVVCERPSDGQAHLVVIDRGIGMSPADIEVAVRPFQQVDNGMARKYQGAGLGLSIVKGMMEQHGGRLLIRSAPGVGSAITLAFPASAVIGPGVTRLAASA